MKLNRINKRLNPVKVAEELNRRTRWFLSKRKFDKNIQFLKSVHATLDEFKPVFILGPPRCGSTLLYQVLVQQFRFAYFQNRMETHKYSLALFAKNHVKPYETYQSDFQSQLGKTERKNGPHEGGYFWRRFYPRHIHDYIPTHDLKPEQEFELTATIKYFQHHFQAPFLSKNLEHSLRLKSIQKMFPEAVYVIVKRDPRSIASSLLSSRIEKNGSKNVWWSVRPNTYEDLIALQAHEQVAYQVAGIYRAIYEDFEADCTLIDLSYEDLCKQPRQTIQRLQKLLIEYGVSLDRRSSELPMSFPMKTRFNFSDAELERVNRIFIEEKVFEKIPARIEKDRV